MIGVCIEQLGSFFGLSVYATFVLAFYRKPNDKTVSMGGVQTSTENSVLLSSVGLKIIAFPPFIALLIALFVPLNAWLPSIEASLNK